MVKKHNLSSILFAASIGASTTLFSETALEYPTGIENFLDTYGVKSDRLIRIIGYEEGNIYFTIIPEISFKCLIFENPLDKNKDVYVGIDLNHLKSPETTITYSISEHGKGFSDNSVFSIPIEAFKNIEVLRKIEDILRDPNENIGFKMPEKCYFDNYYNTIDL